MKDSQNNHNILVHGEPLSVGKFKMPSREFGIMPFWFWNGKMDYDEMEYQLREYYDKGIPGIYIHARFGIKREMSYLSDDWFDRVRFTVEKAQEIGLQVWVYDEYNWPSGTADNQVMKNDPDLTQRYLQLIEMDIPGQFFTFLEGTDSRYHDMEQSEPIYACAILEEDLKNGRPNFVDLMPSLSFDKVITWEAPKGPWRLFYFIERKSSWYIDALDKESTQKFLELTHERYKKYADGDFKDKIRGFYTDEPAMHYFETGKDNPIVPWSRRMFKIFRDANGYDLKPHLPKLFYDIGGDTEKVRYDFWSALSRQYEEAFYKQIESWCSDNDVIFTGHLLYEEWLRRHARTGGNLFHQLRHLHMTGVDHLYPRIGTREMPDEHVALKLASSAAHHFGSTRLLCESMGGSYWDVTMERMKWIADWEYVLGVNLLNPHGFHYSIEGERKRDWPPSQFYHHTWWKDYKLFNDYLARLGYLMSGGRHVAPVAILYPLNSIWANYTPQARNLIGNAIEFDFNYLTDTLLRLHIDFDYVDEDVLKDCEIRGGKVCIRDEEYSLLLLPPVTHIKKSTLDIMEELVRSGGCVLGDALLPTACIEGDESDLQNRIEGLFGVNPIEIRKNFEQKKSGEYSVVNTQTEGSGKAVFINGPGLYRNKPYEILKQAVLGCVVPDIEIDNQEVFYLHRVKDGRDFYFLINPVGDGCEVSISIRSEGRPELWSLETGDIKELPVFVRSEGKVSFKLYMQPFGSVMVSFAEDTDLPYVTGSNIEIEAVTAGQILGYGRINEKVSVDVCCTGNKVTLLSEGRQPLSSIEFSKDWSFETNHENALLINHWKVKVDEAGEGLGKGFHQPAFDDGSWMDFKMGAWEMQLPEEREHKSYPVALWYRTSFTADYIPDDIKLLIDGFKGSGYALFINGHRVTKIPVRSYLDAEIMAVGISEYVSPGTNHIAVRLSVSARGDGILDILKITGSFALRRDEGQMVIIPSVKELETGSWTTQGYPYFSGTGTYSQVLDVSREYIGKALKLEINCGTDIAEVYINGRKAGICLWNPYTMDVSEFIREGGNEISIKITNTLINVLEAVEQPSGLFKARIVPYDRYELKIPE